MNTPAAGCVTTVRLPSEKILWWINSNPFFFQLGPAGFEPPEVVRMACNTQALDHSCARGVSMCLH